MIPTATTQPPRPLDIILDNPKLTESAADALQLLLLVSLIFTRRSLAKIKDRLVEALDTVGHPSKARTYLDPDQLFKSEIYQLAHRTLYETQSSWVALGIFSNGRMSEFGYHFSKLTYEYWVGHDVPAEQLRKLPATSLSSPFVVSVMDGHPEPVVEPISGYCVYFYPVTLGNIIVATVAVGYTDKPTTTPVWPPTLGLLSNVFKKHLKA